MKPLEQQESGWDKGKARAYWSGMGLYTLLFGVLLTVMSQDFRGRPIYPNLSVIPDASTEEVADFFEGEPFIFELEATEPNIDEIYWLNLLSAEGEEIEVIVDNLTQGRRIAQTITATGENTHFKPDNEVGDQMRIEMRWVRPPPPQLVLANSVPTIPVTMTTPSGEFSEKVPLFYFGHKADSKADWDRSLLIFPEDEIETAQVRLGKAGGEFTYLDFVDRDAVTIRFEAHADDLNFLKVPGLVDDERTRVKIIIRNETTGEVIKESMAEDGENYERRFTGNNKKGDKIAIDLLWRFPLEPTLHRVEYSAEPKISTKIGDKEVDFPLPFLLRSPWPTQWFHLLWLFTLAAFIHVWFTNRRAFGFLVLLGLSCSVTSILAWQQCYAHDYQHIDPDGYGRYGEWLAQYLSGEGDREQLRANFHAYSHSHVALSPVLIAVGVLLGMPSTVAYLVVANLSSFGSLLLLWRLATRKLGMEMRAAMILVSLYATHIFVMESFGRASTDALGQLLVVAMLYMLADRLTRVTRRQTILISVFILDQVLVRPPGIVIGPFMLGMTLLCDVWREGKLDLKKRVITGLKIGIGPLLVVIICYLSFNWMHNQGLALEKSKLFRPLSTPLFFWYCMPGLVQLFPLFWIGLARKDWRQHLPMLTIFGVWGLFYTVLLIAVQAPFLLRLFLPVVPSVILLGAPGICWLEAKHRWLAFWICLLICGVNVGLQVYNSLIEYLPPILVMFGREIGIGRFIY